MERSFPQLYEKSREYPKMGGGVKIGNVVKAELTKISSVISLTHRPTNAIRIRLEHWGAFLSRRARRLD